MITPKLKRAGQVEVPFQGAFFLGDGFPMAYHGLKEKCPLRGARSLIVQKTLICGMMGSSGWFASPGARAVSSGARARLPRRFYFSGFDTPKAAQIHVFPFKHRLL